jgi:exodeoxyribonuclease III
LPAAPSRWRPAAARRAIVRYIEAAVGGLLVGCPYLPNGNPASGPKFDYKLRLFERLTGYSQSLLDSGAPTPISRGTGSSNPSPSSGESSANLISSI